jgi:hypothetical protein
MWKNVAWTTIVWAAIAREAKMGASADEFTAVAHGCVLDALC